MKPRYYQSEAVRRTAEDLRDDKNACPIIVLPTGAGKSLVMSLIISGAYAKGRRVGILASRKELVSQNAKHCNVPCGIYAASLKRRDTKDQILFMQIQSVWKKAFQFGAFDILLVDECQDMSQTDGTRYLSFLQDCSKVNPKVRLIGLTATPYRTKGGLLYGPGKLFTHVSYQISVAQLIKDGYLTPLVSKASVHAYNTDGLTVRGGEFVQKDLNERVEKSECTVAACREVLALTKDRKKVLVFACSIEHANQIHELLPNSEVLTGKDTNKERDAKIERFHLGLTKFLINVGVLTTGFDESGIDSMALFRPTKSPGLYVQMLGRGTRLHPGKENCLVLDYGNNIMTHGPIDDVSSPEPKKKRKSDDEEKVRVCKVCRTVNEWEAEFCEDCGHRLIRVVSPRTVDHETTASDLSIIGGEKNTEQIDEVTMVSYRSHQKLLKDPCLRVSYVLKTGLSVDEYVSIEAMGFPRKKAVRWWKERQGGMTPNTVDDALKSATKLLVPKQITTKRTKRYPDVVQCHDFVQPNVVGKNVVKPGE